MQIFGFEIKRKQEKELPSVVAPASDDGSTVINSAAAYYGMVVDLEGVIKTENDLIRRYREIAQYPDCDSAIEDIVNEAIVAEEDEAPVKLNLDELKVSDSIKKKMQEEQVVFNAMEEAVKMSNTNPTVADALESYKQIKEEVKTPQKQAWEKLQAVMALCKEETK